MKIQRQEVSETIRNRNVITTTKTTYVEEDQHPQLSIVGCVVCATIFVVCILIGCFL